jgi:hypothetical protein
VLLLLLLLLLLISLVQLVQAHCSSAQQGRVLREAHPAARWIMVRGSACLFYPACFTPQSSSLFSRFSAVVTQLLLLTALLHSFSHLRHPRH